MNGYKVKCELHSGERIKGELFVYNTHIEVDWKAIELTDIKSIKNVSKKIHKRLISQTVVSEVTRRTAFAGSSDFLGYRLGINALFSVINFTMIERKFKVEKGWEYIIQDFDMRRSFRRQQRNSNGH